MLSKIKAAGIVGCGGAGYPTHAKLDCRVEYLLINCAECEPLLETDKYLLRHFAPEIVSAAAACQRQVGAKKLFFALKEHYHPEIAAIQSELIAQNVAGAVFQLKNYYPAGDEQMIVLELTGRIVPACGIPLDVGAVVSNAATLLCIADSLADKPFTHKYLTLGGDIGRPLIIRAPLGTPFTDILAASGESVDAQACYILGGPMMGRYLFGQEIEQQVVTKISSGLLVLRRPFALGSAAAEMGKLLNRARSACIQCRYCTDLCPRYLSGHALEPHRIMRKLAHSRDIAAILDDQDIRNAAACCECGICESYACPMGLAPRRVNAMLKAELAKHGISCEKQPPAARHMFRDQRRINTAVLAARLGLADLYGRHSDELLEIRPQYTKVLLQQHIGLPAEPLVAPGQQVRAGQLIAAARENALSVNMHSGIDGEVAEITPDAIIVRRNGL